MTRSQIKDLVKKELFRRINKGGTCFDSHIDYLSSVAKETVDDIMRVRGLPKITTKQELNFYDITIEDAVEFFLSHASLEVKYEKSADN